MNKEQNFWLHENGKLVETTDDVGVFHQKIKSGKVGFDRKNNKWFAELDLTMVEWAEMNKKAMKLAKATLDDQ